MIYGPCFRCEAGPQLAKKMRKAGVLTLGQLVYVDSAIVLAHEVSEGAKPAAGRV